MNDGKPLVVSIQKKDGVLFLEFTKTREGLWANGAATICKASAGLEAHMGRMHMGPAAHWLLRHRSGQPRIFTMSLQRGALHIATSGWSGVFRPAQQ